MTNELTRFIKGLLLKHRKLVAVILVLGLIGSLLNVLIPLSIGIFDELVLHRHSSKKKLLDMMDIRIHSSSYFYLFFAGIVLLKSILQYLETYFTGKFGEHIAKDLRERFFHHQLMQSWQTFSRRAPGKYLLRYSGDMAAVQRFFTKGVIGFVIDIIFLVVAFLALYNLNATLSIIFVTVGLTGFLLLLLVNKSLQKVITRRRGQKATNLNFIARRIFAFLSIKTYNREVPEESAWIRRSEKQYRFGLAYYRYEALIVAAIPLIVYLSVGLIMWYAGYMRKNTHPFKSSQLIVFLMLSFYTIPIFKRLLKINIVWQTGRISMQKLLNILLLPWDKQTAPSNVNAFNEVLKAIALSFSYPSQNGPKTMWEFQIFPNSIVRIKGEPGTGKSTLFKLILQHIKPNEGDLSLDGVPFSDLTPKNIRKLITLVSEEAPLIGENIFKAISYKRDYTKREKTFTLLQKLGFRPNETMEDVLNFPLQDRAHNLPASDRKILLIARALLTRKPIVLMDEPFQDLSSEQIQLVLKRINQFKKRHSFVIITSEIPDGLQFDQEISPIIL